MERYYPKSDVVPQTALDLLRAEQSAPGVQRPPGGAKRDKAKAKAQRQARKRNR